MGEFAFFSPLRTRGVERELVGRELKSLIDIFSRVAHSISATTGMAQKNSTNIPCGRLCLSHTFPWWQHSPHHSPAPLHPCYHWQLGESSHPTVSRQVSYTCHLPFSFTLLRTALIMGWLQSFRLQYPLNSHTFSPDERDGESLPTFLHFFPSSTLLTMTHIPHSSFPLRALLLPFY